MELRVSGDRPRTQKRGEWVARHDHLVPRSRRESTTACRLRRPRGPCSMPPVEARGSSPAPPSAGRCDILEASGRVGRAMSVLAGRPQRNPLFCAAFHGGRGTIGPVPRPTIPRRGDSRDLSPPHRLSARGYLWASGEGVGDLAPEAHPPDHPSARLEGVPRRVQHRLGSLQPLCHERRPAPTLERYCKPPPQGHENRILRARRGVPAPRRPTTTMLLPSGRPILDAIEK